MARSVPAAAATASAARLAAFVVERFPFAVTAVQRAIEKSAGGGRVVSDPASRRELQTELQRQLRDIDVADLPETTPGVTAEARWDAAVTELLEAVDGFIAREKIAASLTTDGKLGKIRGLVVMRAPRNPPEQVYQPPEVEYIQVSL